MVKKRLNLREFSRSKRSKSRDKENADSIRYSDSDFTSPANFKARKNRPRASELYPSKKRRLVPYSDSDTSHSSTNSSVSSNELSRSDSNESDPGQNAEIGENAESGQNVDNEFVFAAAIDPYGGNNRPSLSGHEQRLATRYTGRTIRERIEAYVRDRHKSHAAYLDATKTWKTECFIKGII